MTRPNVKSKKWWIAVVLGAALCAPAWGQSGILSVFQRIPPATTVSGLPANSSSNPGRIFAVTDGATSTDCATGGGSTVVICFDNGTSWAAVSSGGGGGTSVALDLTDDDVNESTAITEIATTGDTNSVFSEPSADKLLIAVGNNWPTCDTANAGDSATAFFASGEVEDARVVDALTIAGGTIGTSSITLVQGTAPTPTAEGVIEWDTDDDRIVVGDSVGQATFYAGAHTTDTGPSPDCAGTDTYQDGEGGCDTVGGDISGGLDAVVVADDSHNHGDSTISDTITASNYLPLVGGTMTGQIVADNLGIEFDESDTNPTCAAGNYNIFADLSETAVKVCNNGTAAVVSTGSHFSPTAGIATDHGAGAITATTDFAGGLCGTNEILEDQGASWACIATPSGGTAAWEALTNSADTATTYTSDNTAETVSFDFQSAFTTGSQFRIFSSTGNPSGGVLFEVEGHDSDPTLALFDGLNGDVKISSAGAVESEASGTTEPKFILDKQAGGTSAALEFHDVGVLFGRLRADPSENLRLETVSGAGANLDFYPKELQAMTISAGTAVDQVYIPVISADDVGLEIEAAAAQTADLFQCTSNGGTASDLCAIGYNESFDGGAGFGLTLTGVSTSQGTALRLLTDTGDNADLVWQTDTNTGFLLRRSSGASGDLVLFELDGTNTEIVRWKQSDQSTTFNGQIDDQAGTLSGHGSTTTTTVTTTTIEAIPVASDSTLVASCFVTARRTDADNESAGWRAEAVIDNNAGTTALVGSATITTLGDDSAGTWTVALAADDTADTLDVNVTAENAKTVQWTSRCSTVEAAG